MSEQSAASDSPARRGKLKVYLGMAAGVGKTFRMLREGQSEAANGRDVVIGYLEPHDRADTIAAAESLEELPRKTAFYGETAVQEMDTARVIARRPELALVDELAHTNAPGFAHAKRYEDVRDILAAGIDVYTTMNVQHLESLNDEIAEFTGTTVRETVPDTVLSEADEIVLIDLTPEELVERLRAGKIYPQQRVTAALNNFFKIENLTALRTIALRQVADGVEAKRLTIETTPRRPGQQGDRAVPHSISERAMALVTPEPGAQRVIRRAWRSAQRLGCPLDVLWVSPHEYRPSAAEQEQLAAITDLTSVLGTHLLIEYCDDVVDTVRRVAGEREITYLLLARPTQRRRWGRPSKLDRLLRELPGVDIRLVADRSQLGPGGSES